MADPGFDPRFDAAFQPGYDPHKHDPQRHDHPRQADPVATPVAPQPVVPPQPGAAVQPATASEVTGDPHPSARRNPVLVTLWIISAVLVAAGVYALRLVADRVTTLGTSGGFGEADYYLMQAYTTLAPLIITLGVATAIGTLFLLAVRWRRPR